MGSRRVLVQGELGHRLRMVQMVRMGVLVGRVIRARMGFIFEGWHDSTTTFKDLDLGSGLARIRVIAFMLS